MKIKDLNNTIINSMIMTGTVIDCKEGYMEITQQNLSEPTLTISVPSTVTVGTPTTITVTASVSGSIVLYINQEYIGLSEGSATYQYVYTPQDAFTIEAYYTSQYGTVANTSKEVTPSTTISYAVQSFNSQGINYNPIFQSWLSANGYSANADYTTMEEALNVEEIPNSAFKNNTSLTHMDELQYFTNLTTIGRETFMGCTGLTSIIIPDGLTSIGEYAFARCEGLTNITIPNNVTSIGDSAFRNCTGLTNITISNNVTSIGDSVFYFCTGLTSVTIPNGVTSIGNLAFKNTGLTSVNIPYGVTSIGEFAFAGCKNMTSVTLPSTLKTISHLVFDECLRLTNITIPNSVTTLGNEVFEQTGLTSITIPNSVTSIGYGLFYQCASLSSVTFAEPLGISTISTGTFAGCSALTSLTIPSGITEIGDGGVQDCRNLRTVIIPDTVVSIRDSTFYLDTSLTEVWCYATNPPGLGNYAFYSIGSNSTLYVPSQSVSAYQSSEWSNYFSNILPISTPVTYACQSIDANGQNYNPALQEYLYSKHIASNSGYTTMIEALNLTEIEARGLEGKTNLTSLVNILSNFPNLVKINNYAFRNCTNLRNVDIPRSVTYLGAMAFEGCTSLENCYLNRSQIDSLHASTFVGCSALTTVTLPSTLTYVGEWAFNKCNALIGIYCYATTPPEVYSGAFDNKSNMTLYVPYESLSAYKSSSWANYFSNILPISTPVTYACQSIDAKSDNYNPALQEYLYSKHIASNSGYTTMTEALNLTEIADRGLAGKTNLTSLMPILSNFPNLNKIGNEAFEGCTNLKYADIPKTVIHFGDNVFARCTSLDGCYLDQSQITTLGLSTFIDCTSLTTVKLPSTLKYIENGAFAHCNALVGIFCYATTPPKVHSGAFDNKSNIRLLVPPASVSAYQNSKYWQGFKDYIPIQ